MLRFVPMAAVFAMFAALSAVPATADAAPLIGVNFASNQRELNASDETGVVAQQNWNNAPGHSGTEPMGITDDAGQAAGQLTYSGDLTFDYFSSTGTPESATDDLLGSYLYGDGETGVTIGVTDLTEAFTGPGYEIIVYFESTDAGVNVGPRTLTLDLGQNGTIDQTLDFEIPTGYSNTFHEVPHENANYLRLSVPADAGDIDAFTLRVTGAEGQPENERGIISGMQIVPIPEPASLGLMSLGMLLLVRRTKPACRR